MEIFLHISCSFSEASCGIMQLTKAQLIFKLGGKSAISFNVIIQISQIRGFCFL